MQYILTQVELDALKVHNEEATAYCNRQCEVMKNSIHKKIRGVLDFHGVAASGPWGSPELRTLLNDLRKCFEETGCVPPPPVLRSRQ
jgi:hypothetical protein